MSDIERWASVIVDTETFEPVELEKASIELVGDSLPTGRSIERCCIVPAADYRGVVDETARLRAAVRRLLAAHAEYRDTDSLLTATLDREFPELRGR